MAKEEPRDATQLQGPCPECGGVECGSSRVPVCCGACGHGDEPVPAE